MKLTTTFFLVIFSIIVHGQNMQNLAEERIIEFPDIPGYQTLKCDFHMHSVFSDGSVWPNIRVQEAIKDGLDAISITDHIEYQPHESDIPHKNRNRSYQVALEASNGNDLIILNGSEITRDMPPGHSNAIFLKDANMLNVKKAVEAYRQAKQQGAFVFWNHPHWISQKKDGMAELTKTHHALIEEKLLGGIEVVNNTSYSDEALQIALTHNLTIMGSSDIHGLVDWQYDVPSGGHRPVTLVFAKERSEDGIKDALMERRTAVWFKNILIGRLEIIQPLVLASLEVTKASYINKSRVLNVEISNNSDAEYQLENLSGFTLHNHANLVTVLPHEKTLIQVKTLDKKKEISLNFKVLNAVIAPETNPEITIEVKVD